MSSSSFQPDNQVWLASLSEAAEAEPGDPLVRSHTVATVMERGARGMLALRLISEPSLTRAISARDESCAVIFEGILHNRRELCHRLTDRSGAATDADLIVQAYKAYGTDMLLRVKGIFAVIIWDSTRELLLGARDPLGVYPLFYADVGREVLFSTSLEALIRHPRVPGAVSRLALARHLCHDWLGPRETYFAAVKRVPAGHAMRIDRGERHIYRYWHPAPPDALAHWNGGDELEQFDGLLEQAVDRCLQLGPAAIHLSGGLDSTTVATVAADRSRRAGFPLPWALSIVLDDPATNEEAIQRRVAADLGLPQALLPFDEVVGSHGMLGSALELSQRWPWPLVHPGIAPYCNLAREGQRRGCRVIITGNGGDEWLTFSPHYTADLLRVLDIKSLCRLLGIAQRSYPTSRLTTTRTLLWRYGVRPLLAATLRRVAPGALRLHRRRRLSRSVPDWLAPDPSLRRELGRWFEQSVEQRSQEVQSEGFHLRNRRHLLAMELEEDFEVGRHLGVRVLHPFWDADMVDFLYRFPPMLLSRNGRTKGLIRRTVAHRFPGLGFEQQRKLVLFTFYRDRVLSEGPAAWRQMGGVPSLVELGLVDASRLSSNVEAILSGRRPEQFPRVWDVLNLETWLRSRLG